MDRGGHARRALVWAPLGLVLLSVAGCKGSLAPRWEEAPWEQELRVHADRPLLGVVVDREETGEVGLRIGRVLHSAPAEQGGVRPGDVLVRVGATRVRNAADLEAVLDREGAEVPWIERVRKWRSERKDEDGTRRTLKRVGWDPGPPAIPQLAFELTLLRGDDEVVVPVTLRCAEEYRLATQAFLQASATAHQGGILIPFVIDTTFQEIQPDEWLAYRGRQVTEPVRVYTEIDLIPAILVSLWRWESTPIDDQRRMTIGHWPARLTLQGDGGEYVRSILVEGEERHAIY